MTTKSKSIGLAFGLAFTASALAGTTNSAGVYVISNPPPTVQLTWDASTDPTVAGYNVYHGAASQTYTNLTVLGKVTTAKLVLPLRGVTYFFAVTAVDSIGLESAFSNEVSFRWALVPTPPAMQPLVSLTAQAADWLWGPWEDTEFSWQVDDSAFNKFWRVAISR